MSFCYSWRQTSWIKNLGFKQVHELGLIYFLRIKSFYASWLILVCCFFFNFFFLYWTTRWIAVRMKIELKTDIVTTTFRKVLILKLFFCWFTRKHSVALSHFQYYGKFGCISRMSRWLLKASYVFRATLLYAVLIVWRENTSCGLDKTQGQNIL